MKTYLEFIQEDTAAQRLYKKRGYFRGFHGPVRKGDEKLIDYVENKEKASMMEKLEQYKDDEDVYISFRDDPLVGINPKSIYNTPNGVYCYPLKQVWNKVVSNKVDFAGERPYVAIIKIKDGYTWDTAKNPDTKILTTHLTNETRIKKVCKDLSKYIVYECDNRQFKMFLERLNSIYKNKEFYYNLDFSTNPYTITEENKDKPYVYGIKDCYEYFQNPKHNRQFGRKIIEHLLTRTFIKYQNGKDTFGIIWTLTRELARNKEWYIDYNREKHTEKIARASDTWSYILFKVLGFSMAINKEHEGFIHTSERIQAVIFDRKCYDYEIIDNNRKINKNVLYEKIDEINNYFKKILFEDDIIAKTIEKFKLKIEIEYYNEEIEKIKNKSTTEAMVLYCLDGNLSYRNNYIKAVFDLHNFYKNKNIFSIEDIKNVDKDSLLFYFIIVKDIFNVGFNKYIDFYNRKTIYMQHLEINNLNKKIIDIVINNGLEIVLKSCKLHNLSINNSINNENVKIEYCEIKNCKINNIIFDIPYLFFEEVDHNVFNNCKFYFTGTSEHDFYYLKDNIINNCEIICKECKNFYVENDYTSKTVSDIINLIEKNKIINYYKIVAVNNKNNKKKFLNKEEFNNFVTLIKTILSLKYDIVTNTDEDNIINIKNEGNKIQNITEKEINELFSNKNEISLEDVDKFLKNI